jgi:diguanylate cyclase (GGDEF)-like protein
MTSAVPSQSLRRVALLVFVAAAYFAAGKLGLQFAVVNPSASAVWPATGIALAAVLLWGYAVWPALLVGAFFVNVTTTGSVASALGVAAGNTLEGLLGAYLVNRYARGRRAVERAGDIFKLALFAGIVSTAVSATAGVVAIALAGLARWRDFGSIWLTWWLGDAVGDWVFAPAALLWGLRPRVRWTRRQTLEVVGLLASVAVVGIAVFDGLFPWRDRHYPLEFLCVPLLLWAAFRFEPREAATVVVVLSGVAIAGTLAGFGPFARSTYDESLLLLQAFMGVTAIVTLVLAAAVAQRKEAEERLRRLAVSDPLTGLANYRQLVAALEREISRSSRTDRPFAVLLMDMDGLKGINDQFGHLVGSLALRRVAETLLGSGRGIDTAARFGGDEFALVLPETGDAAAWHVARRVAERVARDGEQPAISVSVGVAVYPRDGATLETLLSAADRSLYETKARRRYQAEVG